MYLSTSEVFRVTDGNSVRRSQRDKGEFAVLRYGSDRLDEFAAHPGDRKIDLVQNLDDVVSMTATVPPTSEETNGVPYAPILHTEAQCLRRNRDG
jgi:hypothetical protein